MLLLLSLTPIEDLVEVFLIDIATAFGDLLLEAVDLLHILSLLLVLLSLLIGLDGLVELLVLEALLLLLEGLNLLLLLEQSALHLCHVLVRLNHLCEEIIRPANGDLGLDEDFHAFLDVLSGQVVEGDLSLDVVVDGQALGDH